MRLGAARVIALLATVLASCGDDDVTTLDAGDPRHDAGVASGRDGGDSLDAEALPDSGVMAVDAGMLAPLRDDALLPEWRWDEKAAHVIDSATLGARGVTLPAGSELYAARIIAGVDGPAYLLYEAGGGAFSQDFWPASTVKLLATIAALEHVNELGFTGAATVTFDSGFADVVSSMYDRAIRVSSNIDYVRMVRIAGFDRLNAEFLTPRNGFPTTVIQRSYVAGVSVRGVPGFTLTEDGRSAYVGALASSADYGCPVDGNCTDLFELTEGVRRVMLDSELPAAERFGLASSDLAGVQDALCNADPSYFRAGVDRTLGPDARICHKPGWVPDIDCLDHGLVDDPTTGARFLIAASTPVGPALAECALLSDMAADTITALGGAMTGTPLSHDAGIAITVQIDPAVAPLTGARITIDARGADRLELYLDRRALGATTGGPRFTPDVAFVATGEHLLAIVAWSGTTQIGYRALRVALELP